MLKKQTNIKAYLIAAVVIALTLLLLLVKLRPDDQVAVRVDDGYQFQSWLVSKDEIFDKSSRDEIADVSIAEEINRIKAYRPATTRIEDSNEFIREKVKTIRFHIVSYDDTLMDISRKYYGTTRRWRDIFESNKDVIADPDYLEKGTKLIIPD